MISNTWCDEESRDPVALPSLFLSAGKAWISTAIDAGSIARSLKPTTKSAAADDNFLYWCEAGSSHRSVSGGTASRRAVDLLRLFRIVLGHPSTV